MSGSWISQQKVTGRRGATESTYRDPATDELAFPTQPLALGDEGDTVTFLVNRQVAAVAKHDGIGVLAISIVANSTFTILLFACLRLAINSRS